MSPQTTVQEFHLKNGLTVLAKEVHAAPVVSVFMWYGVGSRQEPPGQSGLAHFLEHMLFKGTRKFPKGEISRRVARTGGNQNAFTSYDYTAYFETVPAEFLDLALDIESDRMRNSLLEPAELENERTVILSELDGNRNHPQVRLRDLVNAQTFVEHPYRRPIIGWREEVQRLTREQLLAFYRQYYRAGNATLVVVGDFETPVLRGKIERAFGALPAGRPSETAFGAEEKRQGERRVLLEDHGPAALVRMNFIAPPAGDPDQYALTVIHDTLVKGKSSRLYRALVDQGLAADVGGTLYEMANPGFWTFTAVCQPGVKPQQVEDRMRAEFRRLQAELLTPREFQRAVNQTRAQLIFSKDGLTDQALMLGYYQTVAGNWRIADLYPEKVAATTPEQIRACARTYLADERLTVGQFIPLPGSRPEPVPPAPPDVQAYVTRPGGPEAWLSQLPGLPPSAGSASGGQADANACQRFELSNGLVLLVQSNRSNPTVHLSGLVKAGVVSEPADRPGLATVHAEMLDRGTAQHTAAQLADALEFKGASLNYTARQEELNISAEALPEDLELLLGILAETLRRPSFPEEELQKVKQEVLSACHVAQDSVGGQAWQGFCDLAYPPGHPLRRSLITAEPGIRRLGRQDVADYQQRWIRPDLTILSVAGDVDPQAVFTLVQRLLQDWSAAGPAPDKSFPPMQTVGETRKTNQVLPGKQESVTVLGHQGIARLDPEYYQAFLANQILGGSGLSSLLMREVRDEEGLTYSIYSTFRVSPGVRPWIVTFQSDPARVDQAVASTLRQVRAMQAGRVSEQQVDDAREELVGALVLTLENSQGIAVLNREIEYFGLGRDYLHQFPRAVRAVSRQQVVAAANKWFHPDRTLQSTAGPAAPDAAADEGGSRKAH